MTRIPKPMVVKMGDEYEAGWRQYKGYGATEQEAVEEYRRVYLDALAETVRRA